MPTIQIKGEEVEIEFYREDIPQVKCDYEGADVDPYCAKNSTHVNIDDADDTICNKHRLELAPGQRRRYVKIDEIPFKVEPRSASEVAFNGEDEEYELDDDDVNESSPAVKSER